MQIRNNYDKEVFNGDIGRVIHLDEDMLELIVEFDGRSVLYDLSDLDELMLAYAITVRDRLRNKKDIQYQITIDGELIETSASKVYVVNASQSGTGVSVTGDLSSSDDGLLEVFVLDQAAPATNHLSD